MYDEGEMYSIVVQLVVEERSEVRGAGVPDPPIHRPAPIDSKLILKNIVLEILCYKKYLIEWT